MQLIQRLCCHLANTYPIRLSASRGRPPLPAAPARSPLWPGPSTSSTPAVSVKPPAVGLQGRCKAKCADYGAAASVSPSPTRTSLQTFASPACLPAHAVGESYQISFAEYKTQFTEDAGGAMLDKDAIAAVKGVKVRRCLLGVLPIVVWRGWLHFGLPRTGMPWPP